MTHLPLSFLECRSELCVLCLIWPQSELNKILLSAELWDILLKPLLLCLQTFISRYTYSCKCARRTVSMHLLMLFYSLCLNCFIWNGRRVVGMKRGGGLTWSCLTCSWSACWVFTAIWDTCRNFVEHRCFSPSISSAQYLCLSPNSWQVSTSFSSKLTYCMVKTAQ